MLIFQRNLQKIYLSLTVSEIKTVCPSDYRLNANETDKSSQRHAYYKDCQPTVEKACMSV